MEENRCVVCDAIIPEGIMVCFLCNKNRKDGNSMIEKKVKFNSSKDIFEFTKLASKCNDDVIVYSEHDILNAKSILKLWSMDITNPVRVEFHGDIPREVREEMKKFIID